VAADYGDAEERVGPWMERRRGDFFLATKTGDRTGAEARASLERSLTRLRTDKIDLIQLHNLVEDDEWETAFAPGGAVEALAAARDEGLVDYIGVTGHGLRIPSMHQRSLQRFDFDSVLFPYNHALLALPDYRSDVESLLSLCRDRGVAIQVIKAVARRRYDGPARPGERRLSWYEPLDDPALIARAAAFVLDQPDLFLISSSDWRQLPKLLEAAESPPVDVSEVSLREDRAAYDVTPLFDGGALERI